MPKKKGQTGQKSNKLIPTQSFPPASIVAEQLDVKKTDLVQHKINEIGRLLWFGEGCSEEVKNSKIVHALALYESLEPVDAAEGMLAEQMVGTHFAALDCLRRAALPNQSFAGRDMSLKHAQKLMALYAQQLAALNKHRGKGQQKVTVEHVNVEPGGQAIVGTVETGKAGDASAHSTPAIEHAQEVPMPALKQKRKAPSKK